MDETIIPLKQEDMYEEVIQGLCSPNKSLPSKYFYDARGSELFDKITELEEYYPTRCEHSIMAENIERILTVLGKNIQLIEFGSGSSLKTRLLLDHLDNQSSYIPIDISEKHLLKTAEKLRKTFPKIEIKPLAADYTQDFTLPDTRRNFSRRVAYFPGSTIGNFKPGAARKFLAHTAELVGTGGGLLIGVDLKKDSQILEKAYNDSKGITAAFNLNILNHINQKLNADFNIESFHHKAFYNSGKGRIEMHLISLKDQTVRIGNTPVIFQQGETIHTENSYKYTPEEFAELARPRFDVQHIWTDDKNYFSVQFLKC